jgi:two-component system phosphate regulon sensor histidine kinase PhoR
VAKLAGRWLLLLISCPLALAWLLPDLAPGTKAIVFFKLLAVVAVVAAGGLAFSYVRAHRWTELQNISRASQSMADRVQQLMEQKELESARREAILACMAEGVLAVDRDLRVIFCNQSFAEAFSARTPVSEGRTLYEIVREPALRDILERVVQTGEAERDRLQLPTAAGRWFEARALPLGGQGKGGAVIVLHDVTDLQRQEQVRKDFVADVSHELRTPLTAIRGYAETLLDGALDDAQHNRRFVEIILAHAVRLNNIASDLLVLSELDSNAAPATPPERVSVLDVIDSAIHTIERAAAAKQVRINRENCHECVVEGYRFRLEQAMVNLLDNAVKFNRSGGEVTIECGQLNDSEVRISVADTGVGIPINDLNRIFERFYRVDKARARPAGGTGLGLPIVKDVIERMGGTIEVQSQLGRGSTFTIHLRPAASTEPRP